MGLEDKTKEINIILKCEVDGIPLNISFLLQEESRNYSAKFEYDGKKYNLPVTAKNYQEAFKKLECHVPDYIKKISNAGEGVNRR